MLFVDIWLKLVDIPTTTTTKLRTSSELSVKAKRNDLRALSVTLAKTRVFCGTARELPILVVSWAKDWGLLLQKRLCKFLINLVKIVIYAWVPIHESKLTLWLQKRIYVSFTTWSLPLKWRCTIVVPFRTPSYFSCSKSLTLRARFGKGVYLADMASKSANYCCSSISNGHALLLLCEAELGDPMQKLFDASYSAGEDAKAMGALSTWVSLRSQYVTFRWSWYTDGVVAHLDRRSGRMLLVFMSH